MLVLAFVIALFAQAPREDLFPDIPDNHWAFETLAYCKKLGIETTEPTLLLRGNRPWSRHELATFSIHAAISFDNIVDHRGNNSVEYPGSERIFFRGDTSPKRLEYARQLLKVAPGIRDLVSTFAGSMPRSINPEALEQEVSEHEDALRSWIS